MTDQERIDALTKIVGAQLAEILILKEELKRVTNERDFNYGNLKLKTTRGY